MTSPCRPLQVLILAGLATLGVDAAQQTFRASVELVRVEASVVTRDGSPVADLGRDRFEIREDGVVQPIVTFDYGPVPVTMAVVVDLSESLIDFAPSIEVALSRIISDLGRGDRLSLSTLDWEGTLRTDQELLRTDLSRLNMGHESWIWNALRRTASTLVPVPGRRAIILVTDGRDDSEWLMRVSRFGVIIDLLSTAKGAVVNKGLDHWGIQVYVVAIGDASISGRLRAVAERTGGFVRSEPKGRLAADTLQITASTIRHQYVLSYRPPANERRLRTIEVRVPGADVLVRHRGAYIAGQ